MKKSIKVLIASIIAGILYRLGGTGGAWWKNTKVRDLGVAIVGFIVMVMMGASLSLSLVLSTLLLFGALTTYWKKINRFFGDTDENCHCYNWLAHGLGCSLAYLPYAISTGCWVWFIIRTVILSTTMMFWSEMIGDVNWEEFGRGFLIAVTIPILFI